MNRDSKDFGNKKWHPVELEVDLRKVKSLILFSLQTDTTDSAQILQKGRRCRQE